MLISMSHSIGRFDNWSKECEEMLNNQINLELQASYEYHNLFCYFNRDSVALENVAEFFNKSSLEEREHAHKFIEYQNKRGGKVKFSQINAPVNPENILRSCAKSDVLLAFEYALALEQKVYVNLLELHKIAELHQDPQFTDFLESEYLEEQINANYELSTYIAKLIRIGNDGNGVWLFNENFKEK